MKIYILPGFSELIVLVNPAGKVTREGLLDIIMPWLYAPWPDARKTGIAEMELNVDTLRNLLEEITEQYKKASIDFYPIDPRTNDLDSDFDIIVNDKNYVTLQHKLDTQLQDGDRIKIKMIWHWDG
jgi:molybdopterin converting factor small subunit